MKDIYILGVESSCDETSVSIVKNGTEEIATVTNSQIDIHKYYGGVVPEIASREHVKNITILIDQCLNEAEMTINDITAIAVTYGPGVVGSLLVGIEAAKTLAYVNNKPLLKVNHMSGHIYANNIGNRMNFPLMALVISGGHTELIYMKNHYDFKKVGATLDDAIGECYDKVARIINVAYPGGPTIDRWAHEGENTYPLPLPLNDNTYNFSFSGLKSAVINLVHNETQRGNTIREKDLACSFQNVVVDVLAKKTLKALKDYKCNNLILAGGVAANKGIRERLDEECKKEHINLTVPDFKYCTDNATMIAASGYYAFLKGDIADLTLNANSNLQLDK